MGGLAFMFAGNQIISALGLQNVELVTKLNNNKSSVIFGLFILNSLCAQLVSTGAFEVYVNDELVFSKLQMGRVPVVEDIIAALASRGILMR
jgi:selT/selW/selH-like putative selenoprotein